MFLIPWLIVCSCYHVSDAERYQMLVLAEMKTDIKRNSIFLHLKLGMGEKEFYDYCWKMNAKKLFSNSHDNSAVVYYLNKDLKSPAIFKFSPEFSQGKLFKMKICAYYTAFAPWNQQLFADSLQLDLVGLFKTWYGPKNYLRIKSVTGGLSLIRVDGNRQIKIQKLSEKDVSIEYTDLFIEKLLHDNPSSS